MSRAKPVAAGQQTPTFACTFVNGEFFASLVAILREFVEVLGAPRYFFSFRAFFFEIYFRARGQSS